MVSNMLNQKKNAACSSNLDYFSSNTSIFVDFGTIDILCLVHSNFYKKREYIMTLNVRLRSLDTNIDYQFSYLKLGSGALIYTI